MQALLEPQLVDLVDDDEQQLIVFGGQRLLLAQQAIEFQILGIRQGFFVGHARF